MFAAKSNGGILAGVLLAIFIWGGNNAAIRYSVGTWGPAFLASSRFLVAGLLMLGLLHGTRWLGRPTVLTAELRKELWLRGGLSIAVYVIVFNYALKFTTASNAALYIGTAPVWALVWEERPALTWRSAQRYGAAFLALAGVIILFWPALNFHDREARWVGDLLSLAAAVLWTNYGRQCRRLGRHLSGAEMTAHNMWRAGLLLLPFAVLEVALRGLPWSLSVAIAHTYTIIFGVLVAFVVWTNALRHWPTSKVYLFNNLIPLSTVLWAYATLSEPISPNFWLAMLFIVFGVILGQADWQKILGNRFQPAE